MSVSSVVRAAMAMRGFTRSTLAAALGIPGYALGAKLLRSSFSTDDTIRVASAMGLRLALVDELGRVVVAFREEDAAAPRRSGHSVAAPASDPSAGVGEE